MKQMKRYIPAFLVAVIAFQVFLAILWIRIDKTPPYWDEAWYLYQGAVQYDALRQQGIGAWYQAWTTIERIRPPLVPTLTIPFFALFGISDDAGLLVNIGALIVLLVTIYGLGVAFESRRTGILAVLLVSSYPIVLGLAHILLVEMVMIALVSAALLALWRSDGFTHLGWSLVEGLILGLGMLTKVFFFVFVIGPCFLTALLSIRRENRWSFEPRRLRNLALCLAIAVALAAPWYVPNFAPMIRRSVEAAVGEDATHYGPEHPWQLHNLYAYLVRFVGLNISVIGFLALLAGSVGLGISKASAQENAQLQPRSDRHGVLFLLASVLVGYAVFTSLRNQDPKQVVGILPAMAVLSGWGITRLARQRWLIAAACLLVHMVFQAIIGTVPSILRSPQFSVILWHERLFLIYPAQPSRVNTRQAAPDARPWPIYQILTYALQVADLETLGHDRARIGVIPDYPGVEAATFIYEAYRRRMPAEIQWAEPANVMDYDVLIHKTGDLGSTWLQPTMAKVMQVVSQPDSAFQRMPRTFTIPDDGEVIIYGRKASPLLGEAPSPTVPCRVEFGGAARFLGFDAQIAPSDEGNGREVILTYYWESLGPTLRDLKVFIHLLDTESGNIITQDDHLLFPLLYPSTLWQAGRFLSERRTVSLPAAFAGEALVLRLGLYDEVGRIPISRASADCTVGSDYADAGVISLPR
jgi:4-amino-4-deoxy-L-arabinose transferase-like glycosyltransferase